MARFLLRLAFDSCPSKYDVLYIERTKNTREDKGRNLDKALDGAYSVYIVSVLSV